MDFVVYRRRERGRPRNGSTLTGPTVRGELSVRDERVDEFNRLCRVARLLGPEHQQLADPPALLDAALLFAKPDLWSIGGYELVDTNGIMCAHAQTWYLIPAEVYDLEQAEARAHHERAMAATPTPEVKGRQRVWKAR